MSKAKLGQSFSMYRHRAPTITDASGPGTQAGTGAHDLQQGPKPSLKYFSTGPFVVNRDFVRQQTKILGPAGHQNYNELTHSTMKSSNSMLHDKSRTDVAGTGGEESHYGTHESVDDSTYPSHKQITKLRAKNSSLKRSREIAILQS